MIYEIFLFYLYNLLELIRSVPTQIKTTTHVCVLNCSASYRYSIMDVIQIRFPTLAVEILNNLDDQSLMKYKESNRDNWKFLCQERFYWIRILKKFNDYFETSRETWRKAISKTSAGIVKKLAIAVFTFFKTESDNFIELHFSLKGDHSPFIPVLIAAYDGD